VFGFIAILMVFILLEGFLKKEKNGKNSEYNKKHIEIGNS